MLDFFLDRGLETADQSRFIDMELRSGVYTSAEFLDVGVDLGTSAIEIVTP
jgi:hypothetical protein